MKKTSRRTHSFLELSRKFLHSESHWHFVTELLLFGVLIAVSAWPLLSLANAVATSIK
jgi:hypothetical protein